jgi:hypothetical protein
MITKLVGLSLLLCLCPALPAQQSSDLQSAPATPLGTAILPAQQSPNLRLAPETPLGNDTNRAAVLKFRQQLEQEKQLARHAILNPVHPPDFSKLDRKDIKQMNGQELSALAVLQPARFNAYVDPLKTSQDRERDRNSLRAILDPVMVNRELDATKTPEQKKKEEEAARAVLNPRKPSLTEFHSQSIARPQ